LRPPAVRAHAALGVGAGSVHFAERGRSAGMRPMQFSRCGCMSECMQIEPLRGFFQIVFVIFPGLLSRLAGKVNARAVRRATLILYMRRVAECDCKQLPSDRTRIVRKCSELVDRPLSYLQQQRVW
jgi:hypothetical protein